jgi:hypothetical protein
MAVDHIHYDILAQEALRGLVRTVLADAAVKGLPGEHHFYISFDTRADGVRLSPRLRAQYPNAMTIVLQHQYWDLAVSENGFEVGLSFGGVLERLTVPFAAVKGFFDPSVQFGLQFEEIGEAAFQPKGESDVEARADQGGGEHLPAQHRDTTPAVATQPVLANPEPGTTVAGQRPGKTDSGEVVRLDRFRKK